MGGYKAKQEMMDATYRALCRHGYADVTVEKIADEFEKGKSSIYYHFNSKDHLMLSFMDYLLGKMEADLQDIEQGNTETLLHNFIETFLDTNDQEKQKFRTAMFELRSQAPYNKELAEKFEKVDNLLFNHLKSLLQQTDIEEPGKKARVMLSAIEGAVNRSVATQNQEELKQAEKGITQVILGEELEE